MVLLRTDWTVDMPDELPDDGNRYELIDGELFVSPAPSNIHQRIVGTLYARLRAYLRPRYVGRAFISPSDVRKGDRTRNRVQPDIYAVRLVDLKDPEYPFDQSDLLLAVEVLSPSNPLYDFHIQRTLYLSNGVSEYWIVSPDERTFVRWIALSDPGTISAGRIEWHPDGMPGPLVVDIPEFFEDALG